MSFSDYIRRFLAGFLCAAVILPILAVLLSVFGAVLGSLGDLGGERFLRIASLVVTALWGTDLAAIVLLLAVDHLRNLQR
ncbi:MAG: hypothetical protein IJG83_05415 [Thermoguttaceae bacterium]|nr:hypothetical protein [Thermoguttaceae bacterium]MBQ2683746.1 hypothetical protein [Thermoguttaceae bacterium]MBQ3332841.1 hypothetical protein [Thermoguttaceae bacterium]MBQ6620642.1 hypothetical protein [Thermoguttaceae bacterium]MBR2586290.1 hypothetical protein [Thermoguttaceae bacterium]